MSELRKAAEQILLPLQAQYSTPHRIVRVDPDAFPHLDHTRYTEASVFFEGRGFRYLGDYELEDISNDPHLPFHKTMVRTWVSTDRGIVAGVYQLKPRKGLLVSNLIKGLLRFRWLDAPTFFLRTLPTRMNYDFESELSIGDFLVTSNAEDAGFLTSPSSIHQLFLPPTTSPGDLLAAHEVQLGKACQPETGVSAVSVESFEDLRTMSDRMKTEKNRHRESIGWISKRELIEMSAGETELAEMIFDEIQTILAEQEAV